jgi:hypothetical protein
LLDDSLIAEFDSKIKRVDKDNKRLQDELDDLQRKYRSLNSSLPPIQAHQAPKPDFLYDSQPQLTLQHIEQQKEYSDGGLRRLPSPHRDPTPPVKQQILPSTQPQKNRTRNQPQQQPQQQPQRQQYNPSPVNKTTKPKSISGDSYDLIDDESSMKSSGENKTPVMIYHQNSNLNQKVVKLRDLPPRTYDPM